MVRKIRFGAILMIVSAFLTATGQLMWKIGTEKIMFLPTGFLFYGLGAIFMIKALENEKISVVYPLMSIGYLISIVYGRIFFYEAISIKTICALTLIIIGVFFNSYGK